MPEKDQLAAIRHWLLDHHAEFRKVLQKAAVRKTFGEFEGNALTRPPKGFPCEHPAMDLIRCRQWGLSTSLPAATALKPDFADGACAPFPAGRAGGGCAEHADRRDAGAAEKGAFRAELAGCSGRRAGGLQGHFGG